MQTSAKGRELIERFEGLRLQSYQDQRGIWTVGFGHTGPDVYENVAITQEDADNFLAIDLHHAEQTVYTNVYVPINQNQFDALVSLIYNIGAGAFKGSTVLKKLVAGDIDGAGEAFLMWDKTGSKVNQGLLNRRTAERELFLTPEAA